jgi:cbb3-type cytochrome oxidase maturation protein
MTVLIYLVPVAVGLGMLGLVGFLWSLKHGQFDDLEGARPLADSGRRGLSAAQAAMECRAPTPK